MNIKDFKSVEMTVPIQYINREGIKTQAVASVQVVRGSDAVITIPGDKHSVAFLEMILLQVMTGFTVNQQEPQPGIPGHNVEVTVDPSEQHFTNEELCKLHIPVPHRDHKEPWCNGCGLNKDYEPARRISYGKPAPIRRGDDPVAGAR